MLRYECDVKVLVMNRIVVLALALACVGASTADAAMPKFTNRAVTVKISGSQKTTWQATPVADPGCQGKPSGFSGSGTETIAWSQSRAIKAQLTGSGNTWGLMTTDKRGIPTSKMPIAGSIQRSGQGVSITCGEEGDTAASCVGRKQFATDSQLSFLTGRRYTIDDPAVTLTTELYPSCHWVWDGMTVRTGAVLLNVGLGKFDPKRLGNGRSSVTLATHEEKRCENEGADPGVQCLTVTNWRVTLYPAGKKRRR
jgi:hypothetical protein